MTYISSKYHFKVHQSLTAKRQKSTKTDTDICSYLLSKYLCQSWGQKKNGKWANNKKFACILSNNDRIILRSIWINPRCFFRIRRKISLPRFFFQLVHNVFFFLWFSSSAQRMSGEVFQTPACFKVASRTEKLEWKKRCVILSCQHLPVTCANVVHIAWTNLMHYMHTHLLLILHNPERNFEVKFEEWCCCLSILFRPQSCGPRRAGNYLQPVITNEKWIPWPVRTLKLIAKSRMMLH